jgi:hypothetical protein
MIDRVPIAQPIIISCHSNLDVSKAFNKVWYSNPVNQKGYFDTPSWVVDKKKVRICVALPIPGRWKIRLVSQLAGINKVFISSSFFLDAFRQATSVLSSGNIDPNVISTPNYFQLLKLLEDHVNHPNPHPQYVTNLDFSLYQNFTNEQIQLIWSSINAGNIGYGSKQTGVDEGTLYQLSIDDDFLYVCVVAGDTSTAVWKRVHISQT